MQKNFWIITLLNLVFSVFVWIGLAQTAVANPMETVLGQEKPLGNGKVYTWVKMDSTTNKPLSLGVTLTEKALTGLPADSDDTPPGALKMQLMDGSPYHTFESELLFPKAAKETAFTHMGFNYNEFGHGPAEVFDKAHFDVHFYMATPDYRHNIQFDIKQVGDTIKVKTSNIEPPREFLPENYALAPNTAEPRMGSHYADMTSPQLQPGHFDNIFLMGVHNGSILFWEPMLTLEYLKSKPHFSAPLSLPAAYPVSGFYPTSYSVNYDETRKALDIALDGLTFRVASYPNDIYGVAPCLDTRLARYISKYQEIPDVPSVNKCLRLLGTEGLQKGIEFLKARN